MNHFIGLYLWEFWDSKCFLWETICCYFLSTNLDVMNLALHYAITASWGLQIMQIMWIQIIIHLGDDCGFKMSEDTHTHLSGVCAKKKKSSSSSLFFCSPVFFYSTISLRMLPFKVSDFTWEFQFRLGALCSVTTRPLKLRILVTEMAECPHDNNGISVSLTSYFSPPSLLLAYEYFTYFLQGQLCILSIFIKLFQPEVPRVLLQIC